MDQLAATETGEVTGFEKCPLCGGELARKQVEKLLRGGKHTAILEVPAEVCLHCGEQLYSPETVRRFEEIRAKLARQDTGEFQPLGQSFRVG
jgi:YgiT-type zinc finger domain-containing protein